MGKNYVPFLAWDAFKINTAAMVTDGEKTWEIEMTGEIFDTHECNGARRRLTSPRYLRKVVRYTPRRLTEAKALHTTVPLTVVPMGYYKDEDQDGFVDEEPTSDPHSDEPSTTTSKANTWMAVAIAFIALFGVVLLIAITMFLRQKSKKTRKKKEQGGAIVVGKKVEGRAFATPLHIPGKLRSMVVPRHMKRT